MGLFRPRVDARQQVTGEDLLALRRGVSGGVPVTAGSAERHSAVWRAKHIYMDLISTMPVGVFREESVPVKLRSPQIVANPSVSTPKTGWVAQAVESLVMRGNLWGVVTSVGANGWPTNVEILPPDAVTATWDWRTRVLDVRVSGRRVDPEMLWHAAVNQTAGSPLGRSTLEAARATIGAGLSAQQFGSRWYEEGGHPSALLSTDQTLTAEQAVDMKQRWLSMVAEGSVAVLSQGMEYAAVTVTPAEAAFLETQQASGQDVARFFKLPPEALGYDSGESMTYSNVESQWLNLLIASLNPLMVVVEEAWSSLLPHRQYVRFNRDALLRMTTKDRYAAHQLAIAAGWKSPNEVRAAEEMQPREGGDEFAALRRAPSRSSEPSEETV